MAPIDWIVVTLYIIGMVGLSVWLGSRQKEQADYYLAGNRLGPWAIAGSMIATQCSAISLIGAPAFIAIKQGGGLRWLQYELAVPIAAIGILYLLSTYRKPGFVTIFSAAEERMGTPTRKALSLLFLCGRGLATGVSLYAMSVVVAVCLGIDLLPAIAIVGGLSMVYTTIGGIEADIYSDIIQLIILWLSALVCGLTLWWKLEAPLESLAQFDSSRLQILDTSGFGFQAGESYSLWPMLIGGFFLYLAYYGCDQSQAQRLLAARSGKAARKAIVLNGCLRLPLVLTYCGFGVLLGLFFQESTWLQGKMLGQNPDFIAPFFIIEYMPSGLKGVIVAGILAAAMSSLDSNINSMSASLENDFLSGKRISLPGFRTPLQRARSLTLIFGVLCCLLAIAFSGSRATVLELVNAVSSAFNGPILACFVFLLSRRRLNSDWSAPTALAAGIAVNVALWQLAPGVSWLWWNVSGLIATLSILAVLSQRGAPPAADPLEKPQRWQLWTLAIASVFVFSLLFFLDQLLD